MTKIATLVECLGRIVLGQDRRLYRCDPPMDDGDGGCHRFVVVSSLRAAFDTGAPETYIFASDENGEVTDWGELPGSYRGGESHEEALTNAGYRLEK